MVYAHFANRLNVVYVADFIDGCGGYPRTRTRHNRAFAGDAGQCVRTDDGQSAGKCRRDLGGGIVVAVVYRAFEHRRAAHRLGAALCGRAGVVPVFGGVAGHHDCHVRIDDGTVRYADAAGVYRDEPVCRWRIPAQQHAARGATDQRILAADAVRQILARHPVPRRGD